MRKKNEGRERFSAARKAEVVLRLLRGEELDAVSRELGVSAAELATWKEAFLLAGQQSLKTTPQAEGDEVVKLKTLVGDLTMRNELLRERCCRLEDGRGPLPTRRSKR
jgi:transposase-like protein